MRFNGVLKCFVASLAIGCLQPASAQEYLPERFSLESQLGDTCFPGVQLSGQTKLARVYYTGGFGDVKAYFSGAEAIFQWDPFFASATPRTFQPPQAGKIYPGWHQKNREGFMFNKLLVKAEGMAYYQEAKYSEGTIKFNRAIYNEHRTLTGVDIEAQLRCPGAAGNLVVKLAYGIPKPIAESPQPPISCPVLEDNDDDGVVNIADHCPQTPVGKEVDSLGCSRKEFCERFKTLGSCNNGDWKLDGIHDCKSLVKIVPVPAPTQARKIYFDRCIVKPHLE
jgi:hypothetical protein